MFFVEGSFLSSGDITPWSYIGFSTDLRFFLRWSFYSSRFLYNSIHFWTYILTFIHYLLLFIFQSIDLRFLLMVTLSKLKLNIKYPGRSSIFLTRNYDLSTPITEARGRFFFSCSFTKVGLYLIASRQPAGKCNESRLACKTGKKLAVIHLVKIATDCIPHPDEFIIPPSLFERDSLKS